MTTRGQKLLESKRRRSEGDVEVMSVEEAYADPTIRKGVEEEPFSPGATTAFPAARLAERASLQVDVEVVWLGDEPIVSWVVKVPSGASDRIAALAWIDSEGNLDYTATRSTRPGVAWQLTSWARDGAPWGHADLDSLQAAFDTSIRGAGVPLDKLAQVVMKDGTVLVREGSKPLALNPARARRLAARLANP